MVAHCLTFLLVGVGVVVHRGERRKEGQFVIIGNIDLGLGLVFFYCYFLVAGAIAIRLP